MSSRLLCKEHGLLAIVSEFMNPPTTATTTNTVDHVTTISSNQDTSQNEEVSQLMHKLCEWWEKGPSWLSFLSLTNSNLDQERANNIGVVARGLLFTNEFPISAKIYAARRANDEEEYATWLQNLENHNISFISPGLLYVLTTGGQDTIMKAATTTNNKLFVLDLENRLVPKCKKLGSIWTPYNYKALLYTWCEWAVWHSV
jgi:hypothetical protein